MKTEDLKVTGKRLKILDKYNKLKERNNPNRYYFTGDVSVIITPQPLTVGSEHIILVKAPLLVDNMTLYLDHYYFPLTHLSESVWIANITLNKPINEPNSPVMIEMEHNKVKYYKTFSVNTLPDSKLQWKPTLTERSNQIREYDIYPKSISDSVTENYKSIPKNYADHTLLNSNVMGVTSNLKVRGVKSITYRNKIVKGDQTNGASSSQRDEFLMINVKGTAGPVEVEATIQDSTVDFDGINKNNVKLKTKTWELYFGEYVANLNRSELTSFSKRLDGVKGVYHNGAYRVEAMTSETKGLSTFEEIRGNDTQGPYFLKHSPIVIHSEKIMHGTKKLSRDVDYDIDYDFGQIIFKNIFLLKTELVKVDYEYSDSTFKRTLTAIDLDYTPTNNKYSLGVTLINQSDKVDENESSIGTTEEPLSHSVVGLRSKVALTPQFLTEQEAGFSNKENKWTGETIRDFAVKEELTYKDDKTMLKTSLKKVGDKYDAFGNTSLYPSLLAYSFEFDTTPTQSVRYYGDHFFQRYYKNDGAFGEESLDLGTDYHNWTVQYFSRVDTDLTVSSNRFSQEQDRYNVRHTSLFKHLQIRQGVELEELKYTYQPSSNEQNVAVQIDTSIVGLERFLLTTHTELKSKQLASGEDHYRNTVGFVSEIAPDRRYSFQGESQFVDDSQLGKSALSGIGYRLRLSRMFQSNGNYELETVKESLNQLDYRVMKHNANLKFRVKPHRRYSFKYRFKPQFSDILSEKIRYETKTTHLFQVTGIPKDDHNVNLSYKSVAKEDLSLSDLPLEKISKIQDQDTYLLNYTWDVSSKSTFRYNLEYDVDHTLDYTQTVSEAADFESIRFLNSVHQVGVTRELRPDLKVETEYKHDESKSIQVLNKSGNSHELSDSIEFNSQWQATPKLNTKLTATSILQREKIQDIENTFLLSPRVDLFYRPFSTWQLNSFLEFTQSVSGVTTEKYRYSIRSRYDVELLGFIRTNLIAQIDYEIESRPTYSEVWDFLVQFNMNF
jgi:hypothetical protein